MSPSRKIEDVKVNGAPLTAVFSEQVLSASLQLSTHSVTEFEMTIQDTHDLPLTTEVTRIFREGTVITWESFSFAVKSLSTGGGSGAPTINVVCTSDFVDHLDEEKGGTSWGDHDPSVWAEARIKEAGAVPLVQPGLKTVDIERKEPAEGEPLEDGESTWDVMVNTAKRVGARVFDYGDKIIFAKPSWLAAQGGTQLYKITWNSWTDHTAALLEAPIYTWSKDTKEYEGKETLTIRAADPATGTEADGDYPLFKARPGDMLTFDGKANPSDDPVWMVHTVTQSLTLGGDVTLLCWRPLDPPEEIDETGGTTGEGGEGTAGVPTGPIGQGGWNGEQLKNAAEITKEAQRRGLVMPVAAEIAVMTAMQESSLKNIKHGDEIYGVRNPDGTLTTSIGLFQQQDPWGSRADRLSPGKSAGLFYDQMVKHGYEKVRDGVAAGVVAQTVQGSNHPDAYTKHWNDAKLVVAACIEAGKEASASGGTALKAPGELGAKIDKLMGSYEGKSIDVDGAWGAQCYDLAQKYLTDLTGIGMIQANGTDFWKHPNLLSHFTPVPVGNQPRKGDIASWRPFSFKGPGAQYGHVAIYHSTKGGTDYYLSQNPGASSVRPLPRAGVWGWMRPKAKGD